MKVSSSSLEFRAPATYERRAKRGARGAEISELEYDRSDPLGAAEARLFGSPVRGPELGLGFDGRRDDDRGRGIDRELSRRHARGFVAGDVEHVIALAVREARVVVNEVAAVVVASAVVALAIGVRENQVDVAVVRDQRDGVRVRSAVQRERDAAREQRGAERGLHERAQEHERSADATGHVPSMPKLSHAVLIGRGPRGLEHPGQGSRARLPSSAFFPGSTVPIVAVRPRNSANYEWLHGHDVRFGLFDRDRRVRPSAAVLKREARR